MLFHIAPLGPTRGPASVSGKVPGPHTERTVSGRLTSSIPVGDTVNSMAEPVTGQVDRTRARRPMSPGRNIVSSEHQATGLAHRPETRAE